MTVRRAFIIHSLADAMAAVAAAADTGEAVTLFSAPGAAGYLGAGVFLAIEGETRTAYPDVDARFILHCGERVGFAMAAIRAGVRHIEVDRSGLELARLADMGRQSGATVEAVNAAERCRALDLGPVTDSRSAALEWLQGAAGAAPNGSTPELPRLGGSCI
jgi:hypothetical protein